MEGESMSSRAVVPPHVVHRTFAQETVLLNIRTGQYYGIDRIGGRFFEVIVEEPHLDRASAALAEEYGQPLERVQADLAAFVAELEQRGLLELVSPDA
jgi:hypothetical protein